MGQKLTHGVYLPDEGERNCYSGLAANWSILDGAVGTVAEHSTQIAGKAPAVHTHTKSDITDLLNSNFIPSANSYDLGSSSYQWNNLYAKNYYYNGTAWGLDKANEWTENNIFSKRSDPASITSIANTTLAFNGLFNTIFLNTRGSSNRRSYGSFLFVGYGSASGVDNYGQIQLLRSTDKRGDTNEGYIPDTSFKLWRVAPQSLIMDSMEAVRVTNDGTENSLKPITNNATDLGTSTNKWKTLNGINPGALSLPGAYQVINDRIKNPSDQLNAIDLNGGSNKWVSDVDCYLYFFIPNNKFTWIRIFWPATLVRCGQTFVPVPNESSDYSGFVPVPANTTVVIQIKGTQAPTFRRSACLGNV